MLKMRNAHIYAQGRNVHTCSNSELYIFMVVVLQSSQLQLDNTQFLINCIVCPTTAAKYVAISGQI